MFDEKREVIRSYGRNGFLRIGARQINVRLTELITPRLVAPFDVKYSLEDLVVISPRKDGLRFCRTVAAGKCSLPPRSLRTPENRVRVHWQLQKIDDFTADLSRVPFSSSCGSANYI